MIKNNSKLTERILGKSLIVGAVTLCSGLLLPKNLANAGIVEFVPMCTPSTLLKPVLEVEETSRLIRGVGLKPIKIMRVICNVMVEKTGRAAGPVQEPQYQNFFLGAPAPSSRTAMTVFERRAARYAEALDIACEQGPFSATSAPIFKDHRIEPKPIDHQTHRFSEVSVSCEEALYYQTEAEMSEADKVLAYLDIYLKPRSTPPQAAHSAGDSPPPCAGSSAGSPRERFCKGTRGQGHVPMGQPLPSPEAPTWFPRLHHRLTPDSQRPPAPQRGPKGHEELQDVFP